MGNNIQNLGCVNLRKSYSNKHPVSFMILVKRRELEEAEKNFRNR
jgi:hypothetical protein